RRRPARAGIGAAHAPAPAAVGAIATADHAGPTIDRAAIDDAAAAIGGLAAVETELGAGLGLARMRLAALEGHAAPAAALASRAAPAVPGAAAAVTDLAARLAGAG